MRQTRAALRAEVPEDSETHDASDRVPLEEVPTRVDNAGSETTEPEPTEIAALPAKKSKAKGGKKKGKKGKKGQDTIEPEVVDPVQVETAQVLEDAREAAASSTSDASVEGLATPPADDIVQEPKSDLRPASPPSVRMTRRQLAQQEEALSKSQSLVTPPQPETVKEIVAESLQNGNAGPEEEQDPEHEAPVLETRENETVEEQPTGIAAPEVQEMTIEVQEPGPETEANETVGVQPTGNAAGVQEITPESPEPQLETKTEAVKPQASEEVPPEVSAPEVSIPEVSVPEVPVPELSVPESVPEESAEKVEVTSEPVPEESAQKVEATSEPEPKTLTSEEQSELDQASPTPSGTPSKNPSKSPAKSPMRVEESIVAIDALEEALEAVVPKFNPDAGEQSPRKARLRNAAPPAQGNAGKELPRAAPKLSMSPAAPMSLRPKTTAPRSSVTAPRRSLAARPSVASRPSVAARPSMAARPSVATRSTSVAPRSSIAPRSSMARSSSVRVAPTRESRKGSAEVTDYLASRRRPISMSFPTPPPPPKGTKAPTRPTFQLPGEAVAAKLKLQKEERLKREQEGGQRPVSGTMGPPAIKSTKAPTKSNFQLPGEAVAAKLKAQKEERLKREQEGGQRPVSGTMGPPAIKSTKPPTKSSFQLPGDAVAAKLKAQREERLKREEEAAKKPVFKARPVPVHKNGAATVRQTSTSKARQSLIAVEKKENSEGAAVPSKRISSINSAKRISIIAPRPSVPSSTSSTASKRTSIIVPKKVAAVDPAAQRVKGREVFNRDRKEDEQRVTDRREKEEAAKRARAEAAERGRIASREWAEKQKKKMAAKTEVV